MALNVKKVSQLNEVSYSTVDGSALFYIATNTGDKTYNIQLSNLFLATNNLSTFKFASDTLTVSEGALNASGTFNLAGTLNTGNTAITGTLGVSGTSTLHALNTGNTAITGTLGVSGTSTLHTTNVSGTLTATSLVKSGGTSSQFLKADGSIDENSYLITESFDESLSGNGWVELPNGLIFQWCQGASQSDDRGQTVTFPKQFPTICLFVTAGSLIPRAGQPDDLLFIVQSWTTFNVDVYGQGLPDSTRAGKPLIFAIGY